MDAAPPEDFEAMAREANKPGGGAPLQLSAAAMMKNWIWATLDADEWWLETFDGYNGHTGRRLKLPKPDDSGTFVLGSVNGVLQWIATEGC